MPAKSYKMGPGTLTVGEVGSATGIDISCQVTKGVLKPNKDAEDDLNVLCGDVIPGEVTYTWVLEATVAQDLSAGGINLWALENMGKQLPFKFVPNTELKTGFTGTLTVDPIAIGGDVKTKPTSDLEWSLVGQPVVVPPAP